MANSEVKSLIGQQELSTKTITYSTVLGRGAFAVVFKAKCDELPCAAKILHTIFHDDPGLESLKQHFYQECEYLKSIKHPNIVQYLGLCQEPGTNQPVLLMELMDRSLTNFLESSTVPLSRSVQFRLCHDIALALAHLHSLKIIHRDLSSNNVLVIGPGSRAKVSDFGMSKVIDRSKSKYTTPMTMVPGTVVYMPQEALGENPKYTEKLDCFSFGVLVIQIITRLFPDPSPRRKEVESVLSPTGRVLVPVEETECRKCHIDNIDKANPLLDTAIECLALKMEDRPSARELCQRVEYLRSAIGFSESVHPSQLSADTEFKSVGREAKQHFEEEIISLKQQLQDCRSRNSELTVIKQNLEKTVADLNERGTTTPAATPVRNSLPPAGMLIKDWRTGSPAPEVVAKSSSTVMNSSMCCSFGQLVYNYDVKGDKWKELPKLSNADHFGLLVAYQEDMGRLVAVRNTILYIALDGEWTVQGRVDFSPWAIVYHGKYILLLGSDGQILTMQFSGDAGYVHSSVNVSPAFRYASAKICNGAIYLMGANTKQIWLNQVCKFPLDDVLPKTLPKSSWFDFSKFKRAKGFWQEIASLPVSRSTCVSFNDRLLAVGGFANNQPSGDILLYDEEQDKWEVIGRIPTPRYNCLAEVVGDQLVVVGGWLNHLEKCALVEIASLNM